MSTETTHPFPEENELKRQIENYSKKELRELVFTQTLDLEYYKLEHEELKLQLEAAIRKVVVIPPTRAMIKDHTMQPEDLYIYILKCEDPLKFADRPDQPYNKIVLVTRRPFEEEFSFSEMPLYFDDVDLQINSQATAAWFVQLDEITQDIPIVMSVFTEKDCEHYLDVQIDANTIKEIKDRVLTRMLWGNRAFLKQFDLEREELITLNKAYNKKIQMTNQQIENTFAQNMEDPFPDPQNGYRMRKGLAWLLGSGWIVAAILFGFVV